MAPAPEDIREALASNLSTIPGLTQAYAWHPGSEFKTPCLFVMGNGPILYDSTYGRGTDRLSFIVRGVVGTVDSVGSQRLLCQWVAGTGTSSVKTALEADATLGSLVDDLRVTDYGGDQYVTINGTD